MKALFEFTIVCTSGCYNGAVILVTGGTGFIGQALLRHLVDAGYPVRILIRPSPRTPDLPRGVNVEVAVSSLMDERGLQAAMLGIDQVFHLVSGEWRGARANLMDIDILGTRQVVLAAKEAGVSRFFYLSHLGADRASAYPVLKAKAIAEEFVRRSGLNYTIVRSAIVYGPQDSLTTGLARILAAFPSFFLIPGDGRVLLQPIWVEDLATCLTWALEEMGTLNHMIEVGGPEYLSFQQIVELVMQAMGIQRRLVRVSFPYMRGLTVLFESMFPGLPVSVYWLDYLASTRTCSLDTAPRAFGLLPARMSQRLAYLTGINWRGSFFRQLFQPR